MGKFKGFSEEDLKYFKEIPHKTEKGYPTKQKEYYNNHNDQTRQIDLKFKALFQDIDFFLKIKFNCEYKYETTPLWQHFGREYDYTWGCHSSNKRDRRIDLQLFMNLGLFSYEDANEKPTFNVGISLNNFDDEELYNIYKKNLNSLYEQLKNTVLNRKEDYKLSVLESDDELSENINENLSYWIKSPGSVWVSFDEKKILNTTAFIEEVKSIQYELYPIFHRLIEMEESNENAKQ